MRLSRVPFLPMVAVGVACSMDPAGSLPNQNVGRGQSAVINGALDTAHPAVVALILSKGNQGGLCSGTIIKKDVERRIGWVATAAHCITVPPAIVVQAQDISSPDAIRYEVVDFKADPRYSPQQSRYDFAVVRIAGVDESTPVIPLTGSPDGMGNQSPVTSVGFGRTSLIGSTSPDPEKAQRRFVQKTIDETTSALLGYDMSTRGICQGDSGGPVLAGTGANKRVVGIHSFVQGDCDGRGYSARVTAGLAFFNEELNKALPKESCTLCEKIANSGTSECASMSASCLADKECRGYYECLASARKAADCFADFPLAEGPFYAAANCVCGRACAAQCSSSSSCRGAPKCGYRMESGDCATCIESACCRELTDCAADGQCYVCLKNKDSDPSCMANAARKKLATCAKSSCASQCADSPIQAGADEAPTEEDAAPASEGALGTTTITRTGCAIAQGSSGASLFVLAVGATVMAVACYRRRQLPRKNGRATTESSL